jgi:hypothetical protein
VADRYYRYNGPYDQIRFDDGREVMRGATIKLNEDLVDALQRGHGHHLFQQISAQEAKDIPVSEIAPNPPTTTVPTTT